MNDYIYDKLIVLNTIYDNSIQPESKENISELHKKLFSNVTTIKTPLLPHQVQTVNAMRKHRHRMITGFLSEDEVISGKLGILGDEAGTGKTLSVLSYLSMIKENTSDLLNKMKATTELVTSSTKFFSSHKLSVYDESETTNLIIVPHNLFNYWKSEIAKHTTLKYVPIESRRFIKGDNLRKDILDSAFVLTTTKCYKYVQEYANDNEIYWNNIFLDEASNIYMSVSEPELKFQFLWFITNNWMPLVFRYMNFNKSELYHLKDRVNLNAELQEWLQDGNNLSYDSSNTVSAYVKCYLPYYHLERGMLIIRNSKESLQQSLDLPNTVTETIRCKPSISLNSIVAYYYTKNQQPNFEKNIEQVLKALSVPFNTLEDYVFQQQVCKHALIKRKYDECECVICLEKPEYTTIVKCCSNFYCGKCLMKSLMTNQKCPTCRTPITPNDMACIQGQDSSQSLAEDSPQDSSEDSTKTHPIQKQLDYKTKQDTCLDIIKQNPDEKIIIYTMFDNIYYQMHKLFTENGIITDRIENNLFSMLKSIKNFTEGNTRVLFISNINLIRGLTFKNVRCLFFFHEQSSYELKKTLIHSVQRIGVRKPLQIIHLNSELEL